MTGGRPGKATLDGSITTQPNSPTHMNAQLLATPAVTSVNPCTRAKASEWKRPRPRAWLMWILGLVNRWLLLKGLPVLRRIPIVRDLPFVHGYFWIPVSYTHPDAADE